MQNCRATLALIGSLAVLSFGGAGCAQIGASKPVATINSVAGKPQDIPVIKFTRLEDIPPTTNLVTCILPCRTALATEYVDVLKKLGLDLGMTVGDSNSLLITGAGMDVRCATVAMQALDETGDADQRSIEIFPLRYADAMSMAAMVNQLFAAGRPQAPPPPRGFALMIWPGLSGPPKDFAFGPNTRVFAKADDHGNSMVVTAMDDMIPMIRDLVMKLDQPIEDVTEVRMFKLKNADCTEMARLLTNLFPDPNSTDATARPANFNGGRGPAQAGAAGTARTESEYMKKLASVIALPDPRTQSLLVSASKDLMPQIVDLINSLDNEPSRPSTSPKAAPPGGVETDDPHRGATGF